MPPALQLIYTCIGLGILSQNIALTGFIVQLLDYNLECSF